MVYIFLAEGFEECEALAPLDIMRRANIEVKTVGINSKTVVGAHGIPVVCDLDANEITTENLKAVILPGGMPGTLNLEKSNTVQQIIDFAVNNNLLLGAICAAPSILGHKGLMKNRKATCYTGFEKDLLGAISVSDQPVVCDDNIITAYGVGAAFDFGFAIIEYLIGKDKAKELKKQMRF